ncbi:hypothetical protein SAMN05192545_1963 [Maribacter dokdonensis]|uniref:Uncharacterized protein n=1 Tax=Maribacter dokdonensis TaxID=320912 RepID=A0ABY0UJ04_9FLAO|nr:hypothetical protein SAMN05192545_1963 [Maribacter dokdonensis]
MILNLNHSQSGESKAVRKDAEKKFFNKYW